jgi:predicted ATPase
VTGRERIAFHIVTGFLGAGKTTLINHLLRAPELADALVLIRRPSRDGRGQAGFHTL